MVNPATEEPIEAIPLATEQDVQEALQAAKEAQAEWGRLPAVERSAHRLLACLRRSGKGQFAQG